MIHNQNVSFNILVYEIMQLIFFKNINDLIHNFMDIIINADTVNYDVMLGKCSLFTPCYFDDPISNECVKSIKQIIENQESIHVSVKYYCLYVTDIKFL